MGVTFYLAIKPIIVTPIIIIVVLLLLYKMLLHMYMGVSGLVFSLVLTGMKVAIGSYSYV